MEMVNLSFRSGVKRSKGRRRYQRLNYERNVRLSHWKLPKIRVILKLQPKKSSAVKALRRYRDAYVGMMLSFAGRLVQLNNGNAFFFKRISGAANLLHFGKRPVSQALLG
ncbi:hypothetical protein Tsubulata_017365 [Turnera subulata]|uniref:Uncharacterized protein n=1 Tax=Turnera subulata TaxID=218843 RepID=A0A9Q0JFQ5_9ROSI|nr:hypothetical protein Tsubulata_017365 [Turnera subulata]